MRTAVLRNPSLHGGQITDEIMVSAVFNENFPIQLLKLFVAHGAKVNMGILELAEIPRSDGNPEIYNFLARCSHGAENFAIAL